MLLRSLWSLKKNQLTCLSVLGLAFSLPGRVDWQHRHRVRCVGHQVPEDVGGGPSRNLLLLAEMDNKTSFRRSLGLCCSAGVTESHHLLQASSSRHIEDPVEANGAVSRVPAHSQRGHGGVGHPHVPHSSQRPWTRRQISSLYFNIVRFNQYRAAKIGRPKEK